MGSIHLCTRYLIIFSLISESIIHGKTILQRHIRETELEGVAQDALDKVMADAQALNRKAKNDSRKYEDEVEIIRQKIEAAAERMARAGSKDIKTGEDWAIIKSELKRGTSMIIRAYQNYLEFHENMCRQVKRFVEAIIDKYQGELSALEDMTSPDFDDDSSENVKPEREKGKTPHQQLGEILAYILRRQSLYHHQMDSINDLHHQTVSFHHQMMIPDAAHTYVIHQSPVVLHQGMTIQNPPRTIPCAHVSYDNSNAACAMGLVSAAQRDTVGLCRCDLN